MPLVYVFAASKMEAQPVLVLAARDGASSEGSGALIIEHGGDRFAVIITGMGTRNAEAKAEAALSLGATGPDGSQALAGKPDAVLVIGLCGGLTESLREQHIVAYTECLSTGPKQGSAASVLPGPDRRYREAPSAPTHRCCPRNRHHVATHRDHES
jgi:Phosphorylase superfamily